MDVPSRNRARKRTVRAYGVSECVASKGAGAGRTVGVREETVLERDDDELAALEARTEQSTDVLGCRENARVSRGERETQKGERERERTVRKVERGVDLVEDVHGRAAERQGHQHQLLEEVKEDADARLEAQERHDEREGDERALAARQLGQARLPHGAEPDLDLEALRDLLAVKRLQLAEVAGEELGEDVAKLAAGEEELVSDEARARRQGGGVNEARRTR